MSFQAIWVLPSRMTQQTVQRHQAEWFDCSSQSKHDSSMDTPFVVLQSAEIRLQTFCSRTQEVPLLYRTTVGALMVLQMNVH